MLRSVLVVKVAIYWRCENVVLSSPSPPPPLCSFGLAGGGGGGGGGSAEFERSMHRTIKRQGLYGVFNLLLLCPLPAITGNRSYLQDNHIGGQSPDDTDFG